MSQFDLLEFAKASAAVAFDQKDAWEDSRATYFDDLRSTIEDHKITDPLAIAEAEALYNSECDRLFAPAPAVAHWGPTFETFLPAGKKDPAGREIGYKVGLRDNGIKFYAWVQNARKIGEHPAADFGTIQRSKEFDTQEQATRWAYSTARNRIANLKKGK